MCVVSVGDETCSNPHRRQISSAQVLMISKYLLPKIKQMQERAAGVVGNVEDMEVESGRSQEPKWWPSSERNP